MSSIARERIRKEAVSPEIMLKIQRQENNFLLVKQFIVGGVICFVAFMGYKSVEALAGAQTDANIIVSFLADLGVNNALAWLIAGGTSFYGYRQNQLRQRDVERLTRRTAELEGQIDQERSSSGLTSKGETPEEERE